MENQYDDFLLPENFEQMAKAYSQSLKNKGFVFVRLEEEEFRLIVGEVCVLLSKMHACLESLDGVIDSSVLKQKIERAHQKICEKFGQKKTQQFRCVEPNEFAFLSLIAIENLLIIKLMLLSIKSGEFELCNQIITDICSVFAESFSCEGFVLN